MKDSVFIGIGASAGGLQAFKELLPLLPQDKGYVYIIAQHLDPNKKSALAEILKTYTNMAVSVISEKQKFLPDTVYIIPPGYNLIYTQNSLALEKAPDSSHTPTPSVDKLFEALSRYKKEKCVGIVLTGTGHDGTKGVEFIKKNGGITIAQSPQKAQYAAMPQNAIDSGYVDYVFTLEEIAQELALVINEIPASWSGIVKLLKEKEHLDITKYKQETIQRRLHKRMFLTKCKNPDEYFSFLQNHPEELHLLYQNILIGVTEFFRDKEAFEALKKELTNYLQTKPQNYDLRVWSIACSTGEEAYTLAIIIDQIRQEIHKEFTVHIFATDIDDDALEVARKGIYPKKDLKNVQKKLLKKYFTPKGEDYQINEVIRSQIVFTHHDVLSDPPFIKQDLISCRNFLIYILIKAQQELFSLFHYALKEDALLFLGSSESTLTSVQYFKALNSKAKIYEKEKLKNPPKIASHYFSKHLQKESTDFVSQTEKTVELSVEENITKAVFSIFSPDCIIVDANFSIVYKKGSNSFLTLPEGFVSLNIIDNLSEELRYSVKKLLNDVVKTSTFASTPFMQLSTHQQTFVRVIAYPFQDRKLNSFVMLYFQELHSDDLELNADTLLSLSDSNIVKNLSLQLRRLKNDNRALLDELTTSKENMQLLTEELQSFNEELQSSNEELETSNEELQTTNEELQNSIINEQKAQRKLSLILNSTHDGIIGLDLKGRHTFVNNAALTMLDYTKEEELLGKNAHKIWHHTKPDGSPYPLEECTLHAHLIKGISIRKEDLFFKKDGSAFDVEVLQNPIIEDGKVKGAVLSFHDITEKKKLSQKLFEQENLYKLTFEEADIGIAHVSLDGKWVDTNEYLTKLLGYTKEEFQSMYVSDVTYPDDRDKSTRMLEHLIKNNQNSYHIEKRYVHKNGNIVWVSLAVVLLKDEQKKPLYLLGIIRDISQLKLLMYQLETERNRFQKIVKFTPIPLMIYTKNGDILISNQAFEEMTGYKAEEVPTIEKLVEKLFVNEDEKTINSIKKQYKGPTEFSSHQYTFTTKAKEKRVGVVHTVPLDDENISGKTLYLVGIVDITEIQKKMNS